MRASSHARSSLRFGLLALALLAGSPALGQPALEIESTTLTSYKPTGASTIQGIRPLVANRGVNVDGTARLPSVQGWMLGGNPFGERWDSSLFLGDVRLDLGAYTPTDVDLALPAQVPWIIGRSYNGQQDNSGHYDSNGYQGKNWFQMSQPELQFYAAGSNADDVVTLVYGADRYIEFKRTALNGTEFKAKNGAAGAVQYVAGVGGEPDTYVYYDQRGMKTTFFGNNTASNRANWQIWTIEDPAGNKAYVGHATTGSTAVSSGYNTDGTIKVAYDSAGRRFCYTYTTLDSVSRLTSVIAETDAGGGWGNCGTETLVGQVDYAYYQTGGTTYGDAGNLKLVTQTIPLTDSTLTKKKLYRYWTGSYSDPTNLGYPNTLKYVIDYEGYRRADWDGDSTLDDDPIASIDNNDIKPYVKASFTYDGSYRLKGAYFDGDCGCSGGNNGTYAFDYGTNSSYTNASSGYDVAAFTGQASNKGMWAKRTILTRPDGAWVTQYFDEAGQPLSRLLTEATPGSASKKWATTVLRDGSGVVTLISPPANSSGYTHSTGTFSLTDKSANVALIAPVSSGDLAGLPQHREHREGATDDPGASPNTAYLDATPAYTSASLTVGATAVVRPFPQYSFVYTQEIAAGSASTHGSPASGSYETQRGYTMWSGAAALMPKQVTTTYPTVASGNNGSNSATSEDRYLRKDGTTAFSVTADGIFTYTQYTNGQLVKRIQDAQTNHGSDFAGGDDPNGDFGVTETGSGLRLITAYTYDAQGRPDTTTMPDGRVTKMYYSRLADQRMVTMSIPKYVSGSGTFYGPVSYTVTNQAGKVEMQGTVALATTTTALTSWIDETKSDPIQALGIGSLASMKTSIYNTAGTRATESRAYFSVPGSGAGSAGTNYDATFYGYDDMGRTRRVKSAAGTITRTTYDEIGRRIGTWIGTNDHGNSSFPDNDRESSGTDNMVETERLAYDAGSSGKNSNLTSRKVDADGNWATSTDTRETVYTYDSRDRLIVTGNPQAPHVVNGYDTMNRVTASATYSSTSGLSSSSTPSGATNRLGLNETFYDEKGQVYSTKRHKIDASDGSDDDNIETKRWYDPTGRLVKVKGDGQHAKYRYDRVGKQTHVFALATDNDSSYSNVYTGGTTDVAGDIVLQETQTTYEDNSGLAVMRAVISRFHDDLSTGTTGALDTDGDSDPLTYTAANVLGRIQITAMWYDTLDRLEDTVQYGTYGASTFERKPSGSWLTVPSRSATALRTTNVYNTDGTLQSVTDPKAYVTRYEYDALFRQTKVIRNYTDGTPGGGTHGDQDQVVKYEYANGLRTKITADLPGGATDQDTVYIYGTTAATPSQMKVSTGHLLRAVKYPDTSNTGTTSANIDSDSSDVVSYAYNALGEQVYMKDQLGSVIETDLDTGGRQTQRRVATLGSGLDNAVLRIATTYTSRGQVQKVTQYSNATVGSGSVVDDVKYVYDDWGNVTNFKQDVDSDLDVSPSGQASFEVTYSYTKASPTNGSTRVRRTGMTSPGNANQTFDYLSSHNMIDDAASRVSDIQVSATVVTEYQYNGVAQLVGTTLDEPNFYSWQYSSTGVYPDLDRFDRVIKSKWTKANGSPQNFVDLDITYDEDSSITRVEDNILVTTGGTAKFDTEYTNDSLNRLIQAKQGNWNGSSITSATQDERWMDGSGNSSLDQVGNWGRYRLDLNGDTDFVDSGELDDTRTHNVVNELTGRDTDTSGSDNYTLSYDANGEMTDNGKDARYVYDAFGRTRQVKNQSNAVVSEYRYNGLGYRISWHYDTDVDADVDGSDATFYFCHDDRWRIVATVRGGDGDAKEGFVWHNAGLGGMGSSSYIDAVALRDRDANTSWASAADGVREERLYYMQNWRADVSLVASSGAILRGYTKYSAYGVPYALFAGDVDLSGAINVLDFNAYLNMINMSQYAPYGDLDTDGDVDFNDTSSIDSGTGGRGVLSSAAVANRIGYAGYQHAPEVASTKWHVRHRLLDSELGRWTRRDPAEYSLSLSLLVYAEDGPIASQDPDGLLAVMQIAQPSCTGSDCYVDTPTSVNCATLTIIRCTPDPENPPSCPQSCSAIKTTLLNQATLWCNRGSAFLGPRVENCNPPCTCWPSSKCWNQLPVPWDVEIIHTINNNCLYWVTYQIWTTSQRCKGSCA